MELRRGCHLHYIQSVESGLVIKVLNVNQNGKPSLSFKKVSAIHESLDTKDHNSVPRFVSEESNKSLSVKRKRVKVESPYAERSLVKNETEESEFDCCTFDGSKNIDIDEKKDFNITLKQIKEQSRKRKRTYIKDDDVRKEAAKPQSSECRDYSDLPSDEENYDLNVPLCLLKKAAAMPSSLQDDSDHDLKVPLSLWRSKISKHKKAKRNYNERNVSTLSQIHLSIVRPDEVFSDQNFFQPSLNQLDLAEIKTENPEPFISESEKFDYCGSIEPIWPNELVPKFEFHSSDLDESLNEFVEYDHPEPLQIAWYPELVSMKEPDLEAKSSWWLVLPVPKEEQVNHSTSCDSLPEALSSINHQSHATYDSEETSNGDDVSVAESSGRDEVLSNLQTSAENFLISPNPDNLIVYAVDSSNPVEAKESPCSSKETDGTSEIHETDTTNDCTQLKGSGYLQYPMSQCSPQRLFATKKVISPTSQERLCKAMMSINLQENEPKVYRSKFYFKNQGNNMASRAEGHDQIKGAEFMKNGVKGQRKSATRVYQFKDAKVSHHSRIAPTSTQNVIAFTQRQMQDIECVASNLTNQLKHMKEIMEERLHCEDLSASFKYNSSEVKMAIVDATKVEASSKKWLSIMARDCNRFCKIMGMGENSSSVPGKKVHQKLKKISFADEAGGKLCDVRLID